MAGLLNNDSAQGRGIRTAVQGLIGIFLGMLTAVWAVDGVPQVVYSYVTDNLGNALILIGLPAVGTGLVSYVWNLLRKDVPNS